MSPKHRVQIATYNGHLASAHRGNPGSAVADWLGPTLAASEKKVVGGTGEETVEASDGEDAPPDFFAIGFQEMIPLHLALLGLTKTALDLHDHKIKEAIERHTSTDSSSATDETYTLMAKKVLGGIALLVYTRDKTVTSKVVDVRVATAACGIANLMGNKGGVGVRIAMAGEGEGEEQQETALTFVTAHLAAHDSGLERRNVDYRNIVERLVFEDGDGGASQHYQPKRKDGYARLNETGSKVGHQIYDTSYLFFFGDLNYRISTKTPKPLPLHLISHKLSSDLPSLLTHDQLTHQHALGRTLHHLREGPITFPPTYKYKVGTVSEFKDFKKRVPGWCDRVLFATWADGPDGAGEFVRKEDGKSVKRKGAKVEVYRSVQSFTGSDHKPVTAIVALPRAPTSSSPLRLPFDSPFPVDPTWRRKQLVGSLIDRLVGLVWCIVMLAGFNKDTRLGIANLVAAALAAHYRKALFGL